MIYCGRRATRVNPDNVICVKNNTRNKKKKITPNFNLVTHPKIDCTQKEGYMFCENSELANA